MSVVTPPESARSDDGAFARWLAARAGTLLTELRTEQGFNDPAALRATGDKASHELIVAELARWRPADAVLSEEGVDDPARLIADRVWIVDPLDGTREFGEEGRTDWAVHIALWAGDRLAAGAIALPAHGAVLATDTPPATPTFEREPDRIRLAVSRSRPPAFLAELTGEIDADMVPMGSAGAKITAVIEGAVDAYIHAGGQYEWDSAAPVAVALAAGLHASRVNGAELAYNRQDPLLPDLVVCRKPLAPKLLAALARYSL